MQRWEYQTQIVIPSHFRPGVDSYQTLLNDFGSVGWELVNVIAVEPEGYLCVFKRPIDA